MVKIEFIGDREVASKLKELEPKIYKSLLSTITKLSIQLQGYIKSKKLSKPPKQKWSKNGQALSTANGTLRRSINYRVDKTPSEIIGRVGIGADAAKYGIMHEFGFRGTENIRSHLRTIKKAWGKSISPKQISVRSHTRTVNYPERSFMRTALAEMRPIIQSDISKAVKV